MPELNPPYKQYLLGKSPTHSTTAYLHENFKGYTHELISGVLNSLGYMNGSKISRKALDDGLVDTCERKVMWNVSKVENLFKKAGMKVVRQYANQHMPNIDPDTFVTLSVVATHFNVSGTVVGRWLDELGLREEGVPAKWVLKQGFAVEASFKDKVAGGKTRTYYKWNCLWVVEQLHSAGRPFDFDYMKSLKGTGNNSDVEVSSIDSRASELAKEFVALYKDPTKRAQAKSFVARQPKPMLKKIEEKLGKPGWITSGDCFRSR